MRTNAVGKIMGLTKKKKRIGMMKKIGAKLELQEIIHFNFNDCIYSLDYHSMTRNQ